MKKVVKDKIIDSLIKAYTEGVVKGREYVTVKIEVIAEVLAHFTQPEGKIYIPVDDLDEKAIEALWREKYEGKTQFNTNKS